LYHNIFGSLW